jgi:hypothetical protein
VTESATQNTSETLRQWEDHRRRRGPDCLSDRALDGVLAGEIRDAALTTARAHLSGCPACASALRTLTEEQQRFLAESNLGTLAADALARASASETRPRPWWPRLVPAFTITASAAVVAVALIPRLGDHGQQPAPAGQPSAPVAEPDLRPKGANETPAALGMAMYVKHVEDPNGNLGEPHWGEPLHPGDQIRMTLDNDRPGKAMVIASDVTGQISVYQPAVPLAVGRAQALPQAIELDGTLGDEVIVAVRCPDTMATQAVVKAAERALNKAAVARDPVGALGSLGLPCAEVRYAIQKVPRPTGP